MKKRYKMINTGLKDKNMVYYNIQRDDGFNLCQVFGKHTAREIVDELNNLHEENTELKLFIKELANRNGEIILASGVQYRLRKKFNGEWVK